MIPHHHEIPLATSAFLQKLKRGRPAGANRMLMPGKHCCAPYTVKPPKSMLACSVRDVLQKQTSGKADC